MEDLAGFAQILKDMGTKSRNRPRTEDWNPFKMETDSRFLFPESAMPPKRRRLRMAQDNALVSNNDFASRAWAAGGIFGNAVSEGLLFLGYPYLSELAQRPEYRLFGEIRAEEMTRKWTSFRGTYDASIEERDKPKRRNGDDDEKVKRSDPARTDKRNKEIEAKIKELQDFEQELKVRDWFKAAAAQDSFFGISHLYVDMTGVDLNDHSDPELKTPIGNGRDKISIEKLRGQKGFLRGLRTIEPIWAYPTTYNAQNPLLLSWYDPQVWYVMGTEIHKSRFLTFIGRPVPDILKPAYAFGGLSMTQMAQPYVDIWLKTRESVGEMIHAFSVMNLETNLATTTMPGGAGGGAGDVLARMLFFLMMRDNQGLFVTDKTTEGFKNISAPLGGLGDLQSQAQEHMLSVCRIPAVKFTGIQPKGLNATSEGELRAFNDTIHGSQEHLYRAHLTTVYDLMQISLWGERDPDITFDFAPLQEMTPKEKAEIRKLDAETDQIRIDSNIVSPEEGRRKVVNDPESGFEGLDPEDVPNLLEEEEQGLEPAGGRPQPQAAKGEQEQGGAASRGSNDAAFDAEFEEGKHPRDPEGKFASTAGGAGASGGSPSVMASVAAPFLNKPPAAGGTYARAIVKLIKQAKAAGQDDLAKSLNQRLIASLAKNAINYQKAGKTKEVPKFINAMKKAGWAPNDPVEGFPDGFGKALSSISSSPASGAPAAAGNAQKPKPEAPEKTVFPKATPAEIAQAKKSTALYAGQPSPGGNKLVNEFNEKYAGKSLTSQADLEEKVAVFKQLKVNLGVVNAAYEEEAKAAAAKIAAEQKVKEARLAKEMAEKNKQVMQDLGINEQEAVGFNALVGMLGTTAAKTADLLKSYESKAKAAGLPISGFEAALIANYSDGGYIGVNTAMRHGSVTQAQHVYRKMVNKAILAMPKHTGVVTRNTLLSAEQQALYIPGNIVEERSFTSTSTGNVFSGNTQFKITAIGRRAASIKQLSNSPGEDEVLFAARTNFKVNKVETTGGKMVIHMEEMDD